MDNISNSPTQRNEKNKLREVGIALVYIIIGVFVVFFIARMILAIIGMILYDNYEIYTDTGPEEQREFVTLIDNILMILGFILGLILYNRRFKLIKQEKQN
ncbi:MAG: hypothetical protein ACW99Q_12330 [Candidatus Kariarchaeaceae archaeon]|jgi:NADH:ubiquinone oxidoreductase subunit 5 (subunit L)/multisubunit Na+/H+ antiporter MnhA subunit